MIQRIQTIYLLGVVVSCILMMVFSFAKIISPEGSYVFSAFSASGPHAVAMLIPPYPVAVLVATTLMITLIGIFKYKNRKFQKKLCRIMLLFETGIIAAAYIYIESHRTSIAAGGKLSVIYSLSAVLPFIAVILTIMAIRAIRKDDELVREADRIR